MPELPDVENMRRQILPARGKKVRGLHILDRKFVRLGSLEKIKSATIKNINRRGKFILIELSSGYVIVAHMGMTGNLELIGAGGGARKYAKCVIDLPQKKKLVYSCTRKLGALTSARKDNLGRIPLLSELGPEPLDRFFTQKEFLDYLEKFRGRIKPFLMNQRRIAGIGNICADEILFRSHIHPETRIEDLSLSRRKTLYRIMRKTLKRMVEDFGNFGPSWFCYHREEGGSCPRCRSKIKKKYVGGRGTYYCPRCQRRIK